MTVLATCLGYPRIGAKRELKRALEAYWSEKITSAELLTRAAELRQRHLVTMHAKGINPVPINDFSLYDHVLDAAVMVGAVPQRYQAIADPLVRTFAMARGLQSDGLDLPALEMTKWFDTNYHYIVPELELDQPFALDAAKVLSELQEAQALGLEARPVILGPVSFLLLSKLAPGAPAGASTLPLLERLVPIYEELLATLAAKDVTWVQLDEPCLVLDLDADQREAFRSALHRLMALPKRPRLMLTTYFDGLRENLPLATSCDGLHIDLIRAPEQLDEVLSSLHENAVLSLGIIDGRNIWRGDLDRAHALLRRAVKARGSERVVVAPSCSLLHVPVDLDTEATLDDELRSWFVFAEQKLDELGALARAAADDEPRDPAFDNARRALTARGSSARTHDPAVRRRAAEVGEAMLRRASAYSRRAPTQEARFALPPLPTTTIGSFPQTSDVRSARASWRAGTIAEAAYEELLKEEIQRCVEAQETIGLDVLVHGEFERTDMVEYFGEHLEGFAFTTNGWVQSYGSRCVKPPIIYGDVARREPITVRWSRYAQSLTEHPMKGMLTGPVTILQWSFVRDDQPREETCRQIALALRDEVHDLEAAGIPMIQVDEPALREGLPLRRRERPRYLRWAAEAFRLATSGVRDDTQIHTHMCYAEFGDILEALTTLDADVISIETSRSKMEILDDFRQFSYPNEIGPGVYDIHSPRVPSVEEMTELLVRAASVVPPERLWVNPDCGLKTRAWREVRAALTNMVEAAKVARQQCGSKQ